MLTEIFHWRWPVVFLTWTLMFIAIFVYIAYGPCKQNKKLCISAALFVTLLGGMTTVAYADYTLESSVMDYKLKEPLEFSINCGHKPKIKAREDSDGSKIFSSDKRDKITKNISFNKGDVVKIKTVEEYNIVDKRDKRDWKKASVFVMHDDKLLELNYDDIKNQGIDKLLMSIYNEK